MYPWNAEHDDAIAARVERRLTEGPPGVYMTQESLASKIERAREKSYRFGELYGMSEKKLREVLSRSTPEAEEILKVWKKNTSS